MANGKPGAPFGNKNGAKGKLWSAAIERALERWADVRPKDEPGRSERVIALDKAADLFVANLEKNDIGWFKELGDRMDGKAAQAIQLSGDEDNPVMVVERRIVDPKP